MSQRPLRIASRASELALWQASAVGLALGVPYEVVKIVSQGDKDQESSLSQIGGAGVFVKEVQEALLDDRADLAVHSAKDIPGITPADLEIATYLTRGDSRDVLVGTTLSGAKHGATIATGSARRKALLLSIRPDLNVVELRGNIRTRLSRLGLKGVSGVVVAKAALDRLAITPEVFQVLEWNEFCPQIGQGAIAIEARIGDSPLLGLIKAVGDEDTFRCVTAERALLRQLGAGCSSAVGAYSYVDGDSIVLYGMVASWDGAQIVSSTFRSREPEKLGIELGNFLLSNGAGNLINL